MATSANGLNVIFSSTDPRLRKWWFPEGSGLKRHERYLLMRDGSVGFVLMHFFLWFHETIERIDTQRLWDEWGWAVRPIRGQTTGFSNHASGSAGDVNATVHPRGVSIWRTFKKWQILKIRLRMKLFNGVLTWGGDWRTPDGMHAEITTGKSIRQVEKVARRLASTPRGKRILEANPGAKKVIFS